MSRMEITTLTNLVTAAEPTGYTLPAELVDAYAAYQRVKAIDVGAPTPLDA